MGKSKKQKECSYGGGVDCALAPLHYHKGKVDNEHCYQCGKTFSLREDLFWNRDGHLQPWAHMKCYRAATAEGYASRGAYGVMTQKGPKYIGFDDSLAKKNAVVEANMLREKSDG